MPVAVFVAGRSANIIQVARKQLKPEVFHATFARVLQGWYDRKELAFRKITDVQFCAAMGPPGGGRNTVTNRYLRHFSVISVTQFDTDNLTTIFSSLVDWWLKKFNYGQTVTRFNKSLVQATIELYEVGIIWYLALWHTRRHDLQHQHQSRM